MGAEVYRAAIVGLTGIGARRPADPKGVPLYGAMPVSHASAYALHPNTEVAAVCDLREEALEAFRRNWEDVWPDAKTYTDYNRMLDEVQPDLVSVATSDHAHADITVAAAEGFGQSDSVRKTHRNQPRGCRSDDRRGGRQRCAPFCGAYPALVPQLPESP